MKLQLNKFRLRGAFGTLKRPDACFHLVFWGYSGFTVYGGP